MKYKDFESSFLEYIKENNYIPNQEARLTKKQVLTFLVPFLKGKNLIPSFITCTYYYNLLFRTFRLVKTLLLQEKMILLPKFGALLWVMKPNKQGKFTEKQFFLRQRRLPRPTFASYPCRYKAVIAPSVSHLREMLLKIAVKYYTKDQKKYEKS